MTKIHTKITKITQSHELITRNLERLLEIATNI